ncbi:MAG: TRAP transporter substrate-binding protein [Candidatus Eremiobacteraeota bacterium]|nr:TRAP transporter substrate-binding protein [Candidatus Eremiobacteraeota bacterium]
MHTRSRFLAASAATLAAINFVRFPGDAAEFTLKIGTDNPEPHPTNVRLKAMADKIRTQTNGRMEVQVFANSILGGDSQMLTQVRSGALQMWCAPDNVLANVISVAAISNVGFAFNDAKQGFAAMDGPLGTFIRNQTPKAGMYTFPKIFDNGVRQITTSTKPIAQASDMLGFKIRVPNSPVAIAMFKAIGASPSPIDSKEMYTALQTRVMDGQENSLAIIETYKLYEVQKYCSLSNHMWAGYWVVMNAATKDSLPKDLFATLERNIGETALLQRADVEGLNATLQPKLTQEGLTFNNVNRESFKMKLREAGFYDQQKKVYGDEAWGLLEKAVGKLT